MHAYLFAQCLGKEVREDTHVYVKDFPNYLVLWHIQIDSKHINSIKQKARKEHKNTLHCSNLILFWRFLSSMVSHTGSFQGSPAVRICSKSAANQIMNYPRCWEEQFISKVSAEKIQKKEKGQLMFPWSLNLQMIRYVFILKSTRLGCYSSIVPQRKWKGTTWWHRFYVTQKMYSQELTSSYGKNLNKYQ